MAQTNKTNGTKHQNKCVNEEAVQAPLISSLGPHFQKVTQAARGSPACAQPLAQMELASFLKNNRTKKKIEKEQESQTGTSQTPTSGPFSSADVLERGLPRSANLIFHLEEPDTFTDCSREITLRHPTSDPRTLEGYPRNPKDTPPQSHPAASTEDAHLDRLVAQAEKAAERAVKTDEKGEYAVAFELYCVAVDIYYKVIEFLPLEQALDVHERVKMYTRRCESIRNAFSGRSSLDILSERSPPGRFSQNRTFGAGGASPRSPRTAGAAGASLPGSRARLAELQRRVAVMQRCLSSFSAQRKRLGAARALELQITTLNANTFGDLRRLAPLPLGLERAWAAELRILLPLVRDAGRAPAAAHTGAAAALPLLERCDARVRAALRGFAVLRGAVDYVDPDASSAAAAAAAPHARARRRRNWWVKVPVVRRGGLPAATRAAVQATERDMCAVFCGAHRANAGAVAAMAVPGAFAAGLPRCAGGLVPGALKARLARGDDALDVAEFMRGAGMWERCAARDLASGLEKVALVWERRVQTRPRLARSLDLGDRRAGRVRAAVGRCYAAVRDIRSGWPTMAHTDLDMAKIDANQDVALAGIEAYSRALESRAYRLLVRIVELLDADDAERVRVRGGEGEHGVRAGGMGSGLGMSTRREQGAGQGRKRGRGQTGRQEEGAEAGVADRKQGLERRA